MLEVAGGILIAALVLATIGFGVNIALDQDSRNLGTNRLGYWIASAGIIAAIIIIWVGVG